ncbi:MAG: sigma-54 dependent transcriptional regulator [Candidatus Pacebacteria bacterium]|nr:sigma-54 dependent transcriptional regulator [Candidatus Paceibacterota bacterium]
MPKPRILVIDDERNTREGLKKYFRDKYDMLLAESAEKGLEILQDESIDVILVDLRMPGMDGLAFIRKVNTWDNPPLVILFTAYGTIQIADAAMQEGAYDYLTKPLNLGNLEMVIDRGLEGRRLQAENARLQSELSKTYSVDSIIGNSRPMTVVFDTVRQVAPARTTVLLTGESGTGKEVVARAIHTLSPRAANPFVVVHCASLNPNLLESELFGHEKGAFTGAHERKLGRFEMAEGGTLLLDEVGEIDASTQIKLLRVLETRTFERVGGAAPIESDVRLIAATNQNLKAMVEGGTFREDLYYRLNVLNIHLPPLRERKEDIPLMLNHFLKLFCTENAKKLNGFSAEALKVLTEYEWPGNVRELRNSVERMVVMARGSTLTLGDVPADIRGSVAHATEEPDEQTTSSPPEPIPQRSPLDAPSRQLDINTHEKNLIVRALKECNSNRTQAAKHLGISRRTLHRKLKKYDLEDL